MQTVPIHKHIRGASHEAAGTECEDFSGACTISGTRGTAYVAVVADGHGDPKCARSATGSRFAVEVALSGWEQLAKAYLDADEDTWHSVHERLINAEKDDRIKRDLAFQFVGAWCKRVYEDYGNDPVEEWEEAEEQPDDAQRAKMIRRLYGTTLVCAAILPDLCVLMQQGDGCSTVVFGDHRSPLARGDVIPEDPLCVGNVTTSLSDSDAALRMRVAIINGEHDPIAAVFVGTDGVDKSLPREDGASNLFSGIALDVLERVENDSWDEEEFSRDLEGILDRVSRSGSGDDTSVAGVVNVHAMRRIAPSLRRERDRFDLRTSLASERAKLQSMSRRYDYYLTLTPANEAEAEERERYLKSYKRLEKQINATERDLGEDVRPQHTKDGTPDDSEQDGEDGREQESSPRDTKTLRIVSPENDEVEPPAFVEPDEDEDDSTVGILSAGEPVVSFSVPAHDDAHPQAYAQAKHTRLVPIPLIVVALVSLLALVVMLVLFLLTSQEQEGASADVSVQGTPTVESADEEDENESVEDAVRNAFAFEDNPGYAQHYFRVPDEYSSDGSFSQACASGLVVSSVDVLDVEDGSPRTAKASVTYSVVDVMPAVEEFNNRHGADSSYSTLGYVSKRMKERDYREQHQSEAQMAELSLSRDEDDENWVVDETEKRGLIEAAKQRMHFAEAVAAANANRENDVDYNEGEVQDSGDSVGHEIPNRVSQEEKTSSPAVG